MKLESRAWLSLFASGLVGTAGCVGQAADDSEPRERPLRTVSHVGTRTSGVEVAIDVRRAEVTTARTAIVRVTFANPTSEPLRLSLDRQNETPEPLLARTDEKSDAPAKIALVPREGYDVERRSNDCWKPAGEGFAVVADTEQLVLGPDESLRRDFEVWDAATTDDCLPVGTYRFGDWGTEGPSWQFALTLEDA